MNIIETLFLSLVQGIAEWLPISSSGHLVIFENWLSIEEASLSFDVFLHIASLLVIILFFRKEIKDIIKAPFDLSLNTKRNWWWLIIISNVGTAIIGYAIYQNIDSFRTLDSVSSWLLVTSLLLLASKFTKGDKRITWWIAIILGLVQGLAVLPGLSRSGAVIAIALVLKIKRSEAFSYGFLVAIPAMLGSFLLTFGELNFEWVYLLAFGLTFIVGYLTLVLLKFIMKRDYFYLFFVYTLFLSLIIKLI